ncbi:hypothetical protein [Methanolacinia petrolearia]
MVFAAVSRIQCFKVLAGEIHALKAKSDSPISHKLAFTAHV